MQYYCFDFKMINFGADVVPCIQYLDGFGRRWNHKWLFGALRMCISSFCIYWRQLASFQLFFRLLFLYTFLVIPPPPLPLLACCCMQTNNFSNGCDIMQHNFGSLQELIRLTWLCWASPYCWTGVHSISFPSCFPLQKLWLCRSEQSHRVLWIICSYINPCV